MPDLTRPGQVCGMTAHHAERQGKQVAGNVAASLGKGSAKPYKHRDLGFLVDLGGFAAAANPLHVPLAGPVADAITRAYHLLAMSGNRARVLTDWTLSATAAEETTSRAVISAGSVPLDVNNPTIMKPARIRPGRSAGTTRTNRHGRTLPLHSPPGKLPPGGAAVIGNRRVLSARRSSEVKPNRTYMPAERGAARPQARLSTDARA